LKEQNGMRLKISPRNSKLGPLPNLSLPPVTTCRIDAPCIHDCYAMNFYRMWPTVRNAWDNNLALYQNDPDGFFYDLCLYLATENPPRFRIHVGGDFPDEVYFIRMMDVCASYPSTQFLAFTKRYDYPLHNKPDNVNIILSMWPGLEIPDCINDFPAAWLEEDPRCPTGTRIVCEDYCPSCGHKCFYAAAPELPVIFKKH
jgi:Gene product 88